MLAFTNENLILDFTMFKISKYWLFKVCTYLYQVVLASVHNILGGEAVNHVASVKHNKQKYHAEKQERLGPGSPPSDFIQLERKNTGMIFQQHVSCEGTESHAFVRGVTNTVQSTVSFSQNKC